MLRTLSLCMALGRASAESVAPGRYFPVGDVAYASSEDREGVQIGGLQPLSPPPLPLTVFALENRPTEVSAHRWGHTNSSIQTERRLEAVATQEALTFEWEQRRRRLGGRTNVEVPNAVSTTPLFEGIGTHYAHVYVGTPPQRVSVIIDTGSHHTAFPCAGCSNCGKHTDPYYEPTKSSTNKVLGCHECTSGAKCSKNKCAFAQSYTEGSSWNAYQMQDELWVGGLVEKTEPAHSAGQALSVPLTFGCQYSETGLFRTQKADGIMGMSANAVTLTPTLKARRRIDSKTFALCFMKGGGMMMLGGADPSVQEKPTMDFVPLSKRAGWFTVRLLDIRMGHQSKDLASPTSSIGIKENSYNLGKGVIVDSGTTDTYLPRSVASAFKAKFKKIAKRDYGNVKMTLSEKDLGDFPVMDFVFSNGSGGEVIVRVLPSAYLEHQGSNRYVPRIYLTEGSGAVLGANFMQDHSVLFDDENQRVGFARADCSYEHYVNQPKEAVATFTTTTTTTAAALTATPAGAGTTAAVVPGAGAGAGAATTVTPAAVVASPNQESTRSNDSDSPSLPSPTDAIDSQATVPAAVTAALAAAAASSSSSTSSTPSAAGAGPNAGGPTERSRLFIAEWWPGNLIAGRTSSSSSSLAYSSSGSSKGSPSSLGAYGSSSSSSSGIEEQSFLGSVAGATFLVFAALGASVLVLTAYRRARIRLALKANKGSRATTETTGDAPSLLP